MLYGGAAGGAKSALGCYWLIKNCVKFEGSRWLMGRAKRKVLFDTTFNTFEEIAQDERFGLQYRNGIDYRVNYTQGTVNWYNGSQIVLKDLFLYPSDKEFNSLGSLEITGGFIDEACEVTKKAKDVVFSRMRYKRNHFCPRCAYKTELSEALEHREDDKDIATRWLCGQCGLDHRGLLPRLLLTTNPGKNWTYTEFFDADRKGRLPENKAYLPSYYTDNPNLPEDYQQVLDAMDPQTKARLKDGNWDYDDDPACLIDWDSILNLWTNDHVLKNKRHGRKYMTCDIAMMGSDRLVIMVWDDWTVIDIKIMKKSDGKQVLDAIKEMKMKHGIKESHIAYDNDGVGAFVKGFMKTSYSFKNGGQPISVKKSRKEEYRNLKSQCYFHLAEKCREGGVYVQVQLNEQDTEDLQQELAWVKNDTYGKDGKLAVLKKEAIIEGLGRSPDLSDAMMMRSVFDLKKPRRGVQTR
jgi:ribosomal protein S27AE